MQGKTALVLSAGGMFGAYQGGAWKTVERHFQPDMVIGASVGALNGWLIAGGCSGEELARHWLDPSTASLMTLRNSKTLSKMAEWLHGAYSPKVPFGLVVVQLPWFQTKLIQADRIQPRHLLATCSIPFLLPTVTIAGARFTDGGLLDALPIWAAAEMGATRIVAVHSLPTVSPWWIRAGLSALRGLRGRPKVPDNLEITLISPSEPMGTARDALVWKRDNIRRWIDLGERDAAHRFPLQ